MDSFKVLKKISSRLRKFRPLPPRRKPVLSILILSIPKRVDRFLSPLLATLEAQTATTTDVEVLTLIDNQHMTIGEKRNKLRSISSGEYSVFIDDDDRIADDYVKRILEAIEMSPGRDVYCFDVWVSGYHVYGMTPPEGMVCKYGIELDHANLSDRFTRKPNHLMVYRNRLAKSITFPHVSHGEDDAWGQRIARKVKSQGRIDRVLYYYDFDPGTSENPVVARPRAARGNGPD